MIVKKKALNLKDLGADKVGILPISTLKELLIRILYY